MLTIAKFDRYDMVNNPMDKTASFTIWFTGCTFKCDGCYNPKLQNKEYGSKYHASNVAKIVIAACNSLGIKSVVFLGGEPLQQDRQELLLLCQLLNDAGFKIWIYTGYTFYEVYNNFKKILDCVYTIKCGIYDKQMLQDGFPASSNQQVYRKESDEFINITEQFRR